MAEPGPEQSSVDERGIKPPLAYSIDARAASDGVAVLVLEGEFDLAAAPPLRTRLDVAAAAARGVVLDMAGVTFVDSSALRELLRAEAALRAAGGVLVVAAVQPPVARLFELTRTTDVLASSATVQEALELAARPRAGRP